MMVRGTSIVVYFSSVLLLCSQTRAQGYADTSLAAVTAALAYVRPSPSVPAATEAASLATTRTSGSQPPVYGQDGAVPAKWFTVSCYLTDIVHNMSNGICMAHVWLCPSYVVQLCSAHTTHL